MRLLSTCFLIWLFCGSSLLAAEPSLIVYETVPGGQASEHYNLAVKG